MKKINVIITIILLVFSSCYTVKTMNRQVVKGYNTYPKDFTQTVSNLLPVKEVVVRTIDTIYKEGEVVNDTTYITADCDTVKANKEGKKIVYVPGKLRIDSFYVTIKDSMTIKDTRELTVLTNKYNDANITIAKRDNTIVIMTWTLGILGALIVGWLLIGKFNIFGKIKNLF